MNWLRRRGSPRQFFLAAAAWAGQVEEFMTAKRFISLVELVEGFADGLITEAELTQASAIANTRYRQFLDLQREGLSPAAANRRLAADTAAVHAASPRDGWIAAINSLKAAGGVDRKLFPLVRQVPVLHDIFGNPFRPVTVDPAWRTATAVALAQSMYTARDFAAMPVLADALEEAGCTHPDVLAHCRGPGPHVRGCWVVDLVLGKS
jgi:hypothetical protein